MVVDPASSPSETAGLGTRELRERFLVTDLFATGEARSRYTSYDRIVLAGICPDTDPVQLAAPPELRSSHFLQRREAGVVNVGGAGTVLVQGHAIELAHGECAYLGRQDADPSFTSADPGDPAAFYVFSAPAHTPLPTVKADQATVREFGEPSTSNERALRQFIHEGGVQSCQVVMGVTTLAQGSMWNTMPAHLHERRTECYLYFGLPEEHRVIHLMGEPSETRHLVVADRQAVISPPWSIHSGVGTASYSFVWAMAGENKAFDDMDAVPLADLR